MASRPSVSVYSQTGDKVVATTSLPEVFTAPIRDDIVQFVHTNMAKNHRQAYGVNRLSGHKYAAHSWGTGRAVARIPRISGGGTNISGSGAFGNMCRGGRMFAPNKVFRRWHRKINLHQKRYAVCSALAASSLPSLLMARGHLIQNIPEVPLVVDDSIQKIEKTKDAVKFLTAISASDDINRVNDSKHVRVGRGKMRNRRYVHRRGPMIVFPDRKGVRAFRNIFGLDISYINTLNLLHLAPGGHLGRFLIWTRAAFDQLDKVFGTFTKESEVKKGFILPPHMLTNSDITRVLESQEVRNAFVPKKLQPKNASRYKAPTNGMANRRLRLRLNPFEKKRTAAVHDLRDKTKVRARHQAKLKRIAKARGGIKKMVAHNAKRQEAAKKKRAAKKTAKKAGDKKTAKK